MDSTTENIFLQIFRSPFEKSSIEKENKLEEDWNQKGGPFSGSYEEKLISANKYKSPSFFLNLYSERKGYSKRRFKPTRSPNDQSFL